MAFQWVNPKSWMMAVSAVSAYTTRTHYFANVFDIAIIFLLVVIPCCYLWTVFGSNLRQYLTNAKRLRIFSVCRLAL
jgi:threonine/homoserine/homoserine lactone efflux protein